jgi:uncharacterized protein YmfQ (DUF2313 family)
MARDYADLLRRIGPRGPIWRAARWVQLTTAAAVDMARLDVRLARIVAEADLRTTTETVADWERVYGLPEPCTGTPPSTLSERRAALVAKATATGGQSEAYFVELCARAGYAVTITTYTGDVFLCGVSVCGDALYNDVWAHHWEVRGDAGPIPDWLQCRIEALKPAHTTVSFV